MNILLVSIWLILVTSTLGIAFIFKPLDASGSYWPTVYWVIFLITLNVWASASLFSGAKKNTSHSVGSSMGAIPSINFIVVPFYSILSIVLISLYNFSVISFNFHIASQILIFSVSLITVLFSFISVFGHTKDAEAIYSKQDLLNQIKRILNL